MYSSNESQYQLQMAGQRHEISALTSHGFSLSEDYAFDVTLASQKRIKPKEWLAKPAVLLLQGNPLHTIITDIDVVGSTPDQQRFVYKIKLQSPLTLLKLSSDGHVYVQQNIIEAITQLLKSNPDFNVPFEFRLKNNYPMREMILRRNETHYDFLCRQLAHYGLFFVFEQSPTKPLLCITDNLNLVNLPSTQLPVILPGGMAPESTCIFAVTSQKQVLSSSVRVRDYNPNTPEMALLNQAKQQNNQHVAGYGEDYRYGEHHQRSSEGESRALIRQQALDWQRHIIRAQTDDPNLQLGQLLRLTDCPIKSWNQSYRIIAMDIKAQQTTGDVYSTAPGKESMRHFINKLTLIPSKVPYRKPVQSQPKSAGLWRAFIDGAGGDYAPIDEQGRYHVRFLFDDPGKPALKGSAPLRLMQANAGQGYGHHFPLHKDTEVLVTHVHGDYDRPVIVGAVNNADTPSPVTSKNPTQNRLRTWGGHELLMEDDRSKPQISITTPLKQHELKLDATPNKQGVHLATQQGEMHLSAKQSLLLKSDADLIEQIGQDHTQQAQGTIQQLTQNGDIHVESAENLSFKAGQQIHASTDEGDISLQSGADMQLTSQQSQRIESRQGNLQINSQETQSWQAAGSIQIHSKRGQVKIAQAGGEILLTPDGNVSIKGNEVILAGKQTILQGQPSSMSGGGSPASSPQLPKAPTVPDIKPLQLSDLDLAGVIKNRDETEAPAKKPAKTTIHLHYQYENGKPVKGAYYQVVFADQSKRSGRLDAQGNAVLAGVPKLAYTVTYSMASAADAKQQNLSKLSGELNQAQTQLQQTLKAYTEAVKQEFATRQRVYSQEPWWEKPLILAGATMDSAWKVVKQTAKGTVDFLESGAKLGFDIGVVAFGDPQDPEVQKTGQDLKQGAEHALHATKQDTETLYYALSDAKTRGLLEHFAYEYLQELDPVDRARYVGGAIGVIISLLIAKKLSVVAGSADTSALLSKTSTEIKKIAKIIKRIDQWQQDSGEAGKSIETVRRERRLLIDQKSGKIYNAMLKRDLAKVDYVYRGVSRKALEFYKQIGKIRSPGSEEKVYFALDLDEKKLNKIDACLIKSKTQIPYEPDVVLKIPSSKIIKPEVPRPNWGKDKYGYEYRINFFPKFGSGGFHQLLGTTNEFNENWIIKN